MRDVMVELKALRLHGMAGALCDEGALGVCTAGLFGEDSLVLRPGHGSLVGSSLAWMTDESSAHPLCRLWSLSWM